MTLRTVPRAPRGFAWISVTVGDRARRLAAVPRHRTSAVGVTPSPGGDPARWDGRAPPRRPAADLHAAASCQPTVAGGSGCSNRPDRPWCSARPSADDVVDARRGSSSRASPSSGAAAAGERCGSRRLTRCGSTSWCPAAIRCGTTTSGGRSCRSGGRGPRPSPVSASRDLAVHERADACGPSGPVWCASPGSGRARSCRGRRQGGRHQPATEPGRRPVPVRALAVVGTGAVCSIWSAPGSADGRTARAPDGTARWSATVDPVPPWPSLSARPSPRLGSDLTPALGTGATGEPSGVTESDGPFDPIFPRLLDQSP